MPETNTDPKFEFGVDLQKRILSMMYFNIEFLIQAERYVKPHYFCAEQLIWVAKVILDHYQQYHRLISWDEMAENIRQAPKEKQTEYLVVAKNCYDLMVKEDRFVKGALKEFVQRNLFVRGWNDIAKLYNAGDAKAAFERYAKNNQEIAEIEFTLPDRCDLGATYQQRYERRMAEAMSQEKHLFPTAITDFDAALNGGLRRGELGMLFGDAKSGKSIGLIHLGMAGASQLCGRVLHFVLEGSRRLVEDRYDARLANYNYYSIRNGKAPQSVHRLLTQRNQELAGLVLIEGMTDKWDYTVIDLEARMHELEAQGFVADLVIVDYGDLLVPRKSTKGKYETQEACFRDLKTLTMKAYGGRGVAMWTASQIRRPTRVAKGPHPADVDETFVWTAAELADSYAKARIVDVATSLNQTLKEREDGFLRLHLAMARDHVQKVTVKLRSDFTRMIFDTLDTQFIPQTNQQFIAEALE